MAVQSGKDGVVKIGSSSIAEIIGWEWDPEANTFRYGTSSSSGSKKTFAGQKHGAGRFTFLLDFSNPLTDLLDVGDSVTLLLYEDADDFWSIPAVIKKMPRTCDIKEGDVVQGTCEFESNGAWSEPAYA